MATSGTSGERRPEQPAVSPGRVSSAAATALTLAYSAPMPGCGSRYADRDIAHETRLLWVPSTGAVLGYAGERGVGETVLEAAAAALGLTGRASPREAGYLAPLARGALRGERVEVVLARLGHDDLRAFARALKISGVRGPLEHSLQLALGAGRDATLRDVMRFCAARDPLAREYARNFEVTRELARPALLAALSRADSARGALVQAYLEVLSEVPDVDIAERAGQREAEDVSRMARGVLKAGGVRSRRGLEGIANLDGILRENPRLAPTATEPPVIAAAFLIALEYGPEALSYRLKPASGGR